AFSPDGRTVVTTSWDGTIRLWETATGKPRGRFAGQAAEINAVSFSPDGRTVALGVSDSTVLLWDVTTGVGKDRRALVNRDLETRWQLLAEADPATAYQAMWALVSCGRATVSLFKEHLLPLPAVDGKHLARLIADLDNEDFARRQQVTDELEKLGELAEP